MKFVACPACGGSVEPASQSCFAQFLDTLPWFAKQERLPFPAQSLDYQALEWACDACLEGGQAILADARKQKYCDYWPHYAYRNKQQQCPGCSADFIFAATEQKHWYETLNFWVQSHPKYCKDCYRKRKANGTPSSKSL